MSHGTPAPVLQWDIGTRLFHWSLVLLLPVAVATGLDGSFDAMDLHMGVGLGVLSLLAFRLLWGIVGSRHARFARFVRPPRAVLASLRGPHGQPGHDPLAGWAVLALLAAASAQAASGLWASDDLFTEGPLAGGADDAVVGFATAVHHRAWIVLAALAALHVAAIAFWHWRGRRLIGAMIHGRAAIDPAEAARHHPWRLLGCAALAAALVTWIVRPF